MSIPASLTFYKNGKKVGVIPANASYGTKDGIAHIKSHLQQLLHPDELELKWSPFLADGFDGIQSSLDGKTYYLTGQGLYDNEVIKRD